MESWPRNAGSLIDELEDDEEIDSILVSIQEEFNRLYIDDGIDFRYKGFSDEKEKERFMEKVENAYMIIKNKVRNKYKVENFIGK